MRKLLCLIFVLLLGLTACRTTQTESPADGNIERIQLLIKQLDDNKPQVRENATNELILIGKLAEPQLQETLKRIKGRNAEVEWRVKQILRVMPVRKRVTFSDGFLGEFPQIYETLTSYSDNVNYKFSLLKEIARLDENKNPIHNVTDNDIVGMIGEVLIDGGNGLSSAEKETIVNISRGRDIWHSRIPSAAVHIVKLLKDRDDYVRGRTIDALHWIGAKEELPAIKELIKDESAYVREEIVDALRSLEGEKAIPEIRQLLKDKSARVRYEAINALRLLRARESVSDIRQLLRDNDKEVRYNAVSALAKFRATEAISDIKALLKDENVIVRITAARALSKLEAKETVSDIKEMLKEESAEVRGWAGISLVELGEKNSITKEIIEDIKSIAQKYYFYDAQHKSAASVLRQLGVSEDEINKLKEQK